MKCFGEAVGLPQPKHERRAEDIITLCRLCLKTIRNMLEIREFSWHTPIICFQKNRIILTNPHPRYTMLTDQIIAPSMFRTMNCPG